MGYGVRFKVCFVFLLGRSGETEAVCVAIYWLARAGIYHRDISVGNLGWAVRDETSVGLPFDFDHARMIDSPDKPSSQHITGTVAFMSLDLLRPSSSPPSHILRFDQESCFWAAWYIAVRYQRGERRVLEQRHRLERWFIGKVELIYKHKYDLLSEAVSKANQAYDAYDAYDAHDDVKYIQPEYVATLAKVKELFFTGQFQLRRNDIRWSDPRFMTMDGNLTRTTLNTAIEGFKSGRYSTSFLDNLASQSDE
jgi:hypothetical protein